MSQRMWFVTACLASVFTALAFLVLIALDEEAEQSRTTHPYDAMLDSIDDVARLAEAL